MSLSYAIVKTILPSKLTALHHIRFFSLKLLKIHWKWRSGLANSIITWRFESMTTFSSTPPTPPTPPKSLSTAWTRMTGGKVAVRFHHILSYTAAVSATFLAIAVFSGITLSLIKRWQQSESLRRVPCDTGQSHFITSFFSFFSLLILSFHFVSACFLFCFLKNHFSDASSWMFSVVWLLCWSQVRQQQKKSAATRRKHQREILWQKRQEHEKDGRRRRLDCWYNQLLYSVLHSRH